MTGFGRTSGGSGGRESAREARGLAPSVLTCMADDPINPTRRIEHTDPHWPARVLIHLDLDAFFAQAEALDNPSLRGKPVIVGARRRPDGTVGRGVVTTASYEARRFGVHSAMPLAQAERLCPHGIFLPNRFERYRELSNQVFAACEAFSPTIDRVGIDEAYLDVTGQERWLASQNRGRQPTGSCSVRELDGDSAGLGPRFCGEFDLAWPTLIALRLQRAVYDATGLTCSLGVAPTRFLAKIASDQNKPNGITTVPPNDAPAFISRLPIRSLRGVGPVTAQRLSALGYKAGADLVRDSREHIAQLLGEFGTRLWDAAHAVDVSRRHEGFAASNGADDERKSISHETTFPEDTADRALLIATLADLTARVAYKLRTKGLRAGCVSLKLRLADFTTLTRDRSLADVSAGAIRFSGNEADFLPVATALLNTLLQRHPLSAQPVRLIGVKVSHLAAHADRQLRLDESESFERHAALVRAADVIRARHGYASITSALAAERPRRRRSPT